MSGGVREELAAVLDTHRWKSMGVSSVECECGTICYGPETLTEFPADQAFRLHVAELQEAVVERVVAEARTEALREHCAEVDDRALMVAEERGLAIGRAEVVAQVEALLPGFEADYGIQSSPVARLRAVLRRAGGGE